MVGQLQLATFLNDAGLEATGNNLFQETAASGAATTGNPGAPGLRQRCMQGYTEASNVDPVSEITDLIVAQRAYEMNSKVDHHRRPDALHRQHQIEDVGR